MSEQMKQVIIVREDLNLPKGKLCAQVAHASLSAVHEVKKRDPKILKAWMSQGARKIVLKVKSKKELLDLFQKASDKEIKAALVKDKGLTVVEPGTITCVGIGPASSEEIDKITSHLKIL